MSETNGKKKAADPVVPTPYTVLRPRSTDDGSTAYEVVLEGDYPSPAAAFAHVVQSAQLGDGDTASYVVVASKFMKPRTAKIEVERKLVYS